MSCKLYWGRPGSYKTSSAVKTDLPEFVFEGRTVVTNVRGLDNRDRIVRVLEKQFKKKVPEEFKIIYVDSKTADGKDKWAKFFHWAPIGCAFIVDEVQDVWKRKWTQTFVNSLDYVGGANKAAEDGRPLDFAIAFEQHRHYNWDFVCTTPHIKRIRDDVREIADFAYKHRNQALIGVGKCFNQFGHDPDNNCRSTRDAEISSYGKRIPSWTFDLYESTATGEFSDTRSGFKFWKDPKIAGLLGLWVICMLFIAFNFDDIKTYIPGMKAEEGEQVVIDTGQYVETPQKERVYKRKNSYFSDLSQVDVHYAGKIKQKGVLTYLFSIEAKGEKEGTVVDDKFFQTLGYAIVEINRNMVMVGNEVEQYYIKTKGAKDDKGLF